MNLLRSVGSSLRGIYDKAMVADADDKLKASIDKLNRISDAIRDDSPDARADVIDQVAMQR